MTTVVTVQQGGTNANNAAGARANLGVLAYNFVNTATVTAVVTNTTTGNANISFNLTSADYGLITGSVDSSTDYGSIV